MAHDQGTPAWQEKLLPFMRGMLLFLTAFFIVATLYQAYSVQSRIITLGRDELPALAGAPDNVPDWRVRVALEGYAMRLRYQHSSLILMSRAWIIYLGFVTGMILAMVGASFILGKITEAESQLAAKAQGAELSFKSASPGLVMAVLGTVLMISTMVVRADVTVTDAPLYFLPEVRLPEAASSLPRDVLQPQAAPANTNDSGLDEIRKRAEERTTKR